MDCTDFLKYKNTHHFSEIKNCRRLSFVFLFVQHEIEYRNFFGYYFFIFEFHSLYLLMPLYQIVNLE